MFTKDYKTVFKRQLLRTPAQWGWFDPIIFIAVVTPLYLFFELGFNASLLNTTGTLVSYAQVQNIEQWGRVISGVALALFIWGVGIIPLAGKLRWKLSTLFIVLIVTLALSILFTFNLEKYLVDREAHAQTAAQRRLDFQLQEAQGSIFKGNLTLSGVPANFDLNSPAGKAFMSVFPFMATSVPDLEKKIKEGLPDAVKKTILQQSDSVKLFNSTVLIADLHLKDSYQRYVNGENERDAALNNKPAEESQQWNRYVQDLQDNGLNCSKVPLRYWRQVRAKLLDRGLDLPFGWDPGDRVTFDQAVDRQVEEAANQHYDSATSFVTGRPLPLNMTYKDFARIPQVDRSWRKSLNLADGKYLWLTPVTTFDEWKTRYYDPWIDSQVQQELNNIFLPTEEFEPGGSMAQQGFQAAEAMYAPPMALGFSIIGALVHLYKAAKYILLIWLRRHAKIINVATLTLAISLGVTPFFIPNAISQSQIFDALKRDLTQNNSGLSGTAFILLTQWVVQAQPYFYPVNEVFASLLADLGFQFDQNAPFGGSSEN